jgi:arylsulfatase A-like enzyme
MLGDHHMLGKGVMYEEAVRIPWILRAPWLGSESRRIEGPVSQIDFVPTVLDLLGVAPDPELPGRSLVPLLESGGPARDPVVIEWNTQDARGDYARTVLDPDGWKLNAYQNDGWELLNLATDPHELENCFGREECDATLERLRGVLEDWQRRTGDRLELGRRGRRRLLSGLWKTAGPGSGS